MTLGVAIETGGMKNAGGTVVDAVDFGLVLGLELDQSRMDAVEFVVMHYRLLERSRSHSPEGGPLVVGTRSDCLGTVMLAVQFGPGESNTESYNCNCLCSG